MDVYDMTNYDPIQASLMEEMCILVDCDDNVLGFASKKDTHLIKNIKRGMLHRAFSVFLFDEENRLLLQQRSNKKITFPALWTNSCCSHPLAVPEELEEQDQLGVKRAAVRKLNHELGIDMSQVPLENFIYLSRIHYSSTSDSIWGEHEVDYILFFKGKFNVELNPEEVCALKYVSQEELKEALGGRRPHLFSTGFTPWFKFIAQKDLFKWWQALSDGTINQHIDKKIHRANEIS